MARKKSAEELALEAELNAASKSKKELANEAAAAKKAAKKLAKQQQVDAELGAGSADAAAVKPKKPLLSGKLAFLKTPRGIAAIVIAVVIVALAAFGIYRLWFSNSTDRWDGSSDISWYDADKDAQTQDGQPVGQDFTITTAEQLAGISKLTNEQQVTFDNWNFTLGRNLDLGDLEFKMIADGTQDNGKYHEFHGSFDGLGHTISGINIEEDQWDHAGLFGNFDGAYLKNLTVEGRVVGQVRVGGIAGEVSGADLENLTNRCTVTSLKTATNYYPVTTDCGGVIGCYLAITTRTDKAHITNLVNEGDVSARACSIGGVIGTIANTEGFTLEVSNLTNNGSVTSFCESDERDEGAGGVIGFVGALGKSVYTNLVNNGDVKCSTVYNVGGVVGVMNAADITGKNFKNAGRISANATDEIAHVGGIFGYLDYDDIEFDGLVNEGELAATNGNSDDLYSTGNQEAWDTWEDEHPDTYY